MTKCLYLHGMPGGAEEAGLFLKDMSGIEFICINRASDGLETSEEIEAALLERIDNAAAGEDFHLFAFSIGAFWALRIAPHLGKSVKSLRLFSPALPLDTISNGVKIAGSEIFETARDAPFLFSIMTYFQRFLSLYSKGILVKLFTSKMDESDKILFSNPRNLRLFERTICDTFTNHSKQYMSEIRAFAITSRFDLETPNYHKIHVYHGKSDIWSRLDQSFDFFGVLDNGLGNILIHEIENAGHYSALVKGIQTALDEIRTSIASQ